MASVKELEKDFQALVKRRALGQAYVLHGPVGTVQFALAKSLANFLETHSASSGQAGEWQEPTNILLDAKFVDGTKQDLGVDVAREFTEFLYRQPVRSSRRTLVVNSAAEFTPQAQNAILKLVEEPPRHGLVILTIRDVNSLLMPLRSRLQTFYVAPEPGQKLKLSALEERAAGLAEKFLLSRPDARKQLIKQLVEMDKDEEVEKSEKIIDTFVSCLILELAKKPQENVAALKELLKRQTAMGDYKTNRKLQLEAAAQVLR